MHCELCYGWRMVVARGCARARVGVHTVRWAGRLTLRLLALKNGIDELVDNPGVLLFGLCVPSRERGEQSGVGAGCDREKRFSSQRRTGDDDTVAQARPRNT